MGTTTQVNILVKPIMLTGTSATQVVCGIDPKYSADGKYVVGGVIILPALPAGDDYQLNFELDQPNPLNFTKWHTDMFASKKDQCPSVGNMNGQFKRDSVAITAGKLAVKVTPVLPENKVHYALYFEEGGKRYVCDPISVPGGRYPGSR